MKDRVEVVSIQAGRIRELLDDQGRHWRSAITRETLPGPVEA